MSGIAQDFDDTDLDGPLSVLSLADAQEEDEHWSHAHRREPYFQSHLDYEDYAAAYCVGYIGYTQYGGTFEDAERSLIANWVRIKGDSRLTLEDALPAIRAAWDRLAGSGETRDVAPAHTEQFHPLAVRPSLSLVAVPA